MDLGKMYKNYLLEREDAHTVTSQHGFATYKWGPSYVYIVDIYTTPEHRQSNTASKLADNIAKKAKRHGIYTLVGSVDTAAKNPSLGAKALLAYGFEISHIDSSVIYFKKEIA